MTHSIKTLFLLNFLLCGLLQAKPNIIWLMAEDMGQDLSCYGAAGVSTPYLDQLAEEGILYERAYATSPICSPSRSAMMVGADQGIFDAQHHRSGRETPLAQQFRPITQLLRESGYTCLLGHSFARGKGRKTDCNFKHTKTGPWDGETNFGLFDEARDFTITDQPFFAQITLNTTHRGDWWSNLEGTVDPGEVELPPYLADHPKVRADWAAYLTTVQQMDGTVGKILAELERLGLSDNTIVIFIADNGRCQLRGKGYLYEDGVKVPLIVFDPRSSGKSSKVSSLVSLVDVSASVLSFASISLPDYITGVPLPQEDNEGGREFVRSARDIWDEIDDCSRSICTTDYKYIINHRPEVPWEAGQAYLDLNRPALHVMRKLSSEGKMNADQLVFFQTKKPEEELYDLKSDPFELNNLVGDPKFTETVVQMRRYELGWLSRNRDYGIEDLGSRSPQLGLAAERARAHVREKKPDLWDRLTAGELLPTHSWMKEWGSN